jgi:hypothetical protein
MNLCEQLPQFVVVSNYNGRLVYFIYKSSGGLVLGSGQDVLVWLEYYLKSMYIYIYYIYMWIYILKFCYLLLTTLWHHCVCFYSYIVTLLTSLLSGIATNNHLCTDRDSNTGQLEVRGCHLHHSALDYHFIAFFLKHNYKSCNQNLSVNSPAFLLELTASNNVVITSLIDVGVIIGWCGCCCDQEVYSVNLWWLT